MKTYHRKEDSRNCRALNPCQDKAEVMLINVVCVFFAGSCSYRHGDGKHRFRKYVTDQDLPTFLNK